MPIDRKHLGRRYGPFRFHVGREHVRDFVHAVGGGVPGHVFETPTTVFHPATFAADGEAAADVVAPPTFAAAFAITSIRDRGGEGSRACPRRSEVRQHRSRG